MTEYKWPNLKDVIRVANSAARLALTPVDGMLVLQLDNSYLYAYNSTLSAWILVNSAIGGNTITLGPTDTNFAGTINALPSDNYDIIVTGNITVITQQTITKQVSWDHQKNAKIINATDGLTSIIKFSADSRIKYIDIENKANVTNAIELSSNTTIDNCKITQNGTGKTLTNSLLVNTGFKGVINGVTIQTLGTITNMGGTDTDGNSEIRIA